MSDEEKEKTSYRLQGARCKVQKQFLVFGFWFLVFGLIHQLPD